MGRLAMLQRVGEIFVAGMVPRRRIRQLEQRALALAAGIGTCLVWLSLRAPGSGPELWPGACGVLLLAVPVASFVLWRRSGGYRQTLVGQLVPGGVEVAVTRRNGKAGPVHFVPEGTCFTLYLGASRQVGGHAAQELKLDYPGDALHIWLGPEAERVQFARLEKGLRAFGLSIGMTDDDLRAVGRATSDFASAEDRRASKLRSGQGLWTEPGPYSDSGSHALLRRNPDAAIDVRRFGVDAALLVTAMAAVCGIAWFVPTEPQLALLLLIVVPLAAAQVFGTAMRVVTGTFRSAPVRLDVGRREVRVVRWGWPVVRAAIPVSEGATVEFLQEPFPRVSGPGRRCAIHTVVPGRSVADGGRLLRWASYYTLDEAAINELGAALRAYGANLHVVKK